VNLGVGVHRSIGRINPFHLTGDDWPVTATKAPQVIHHKAPQEDEKIVEN
jgi:hypothetical protein